MEFTITKEQILKLEKVGGADVSLYLNIEFPDAFNTELELNKWYTREDCENTIVFITHKLDGNIYGGYGICIGDWEGNFIADNDVFRCIPATREEVSAALEKETINRYGVDWKNTKIEAHADGKSWIGNGLNKGFFVAGIDGGKVFSRHGVLYSNGVWAEPLAEKTVIPREKALKILAEKLKVSPENIEIK